MIKNVNSQNLKLVGTQLKTMFNLNKDTMTTEEREIKSAEWRKKNLSKNSVLANVSGSLPNEIDLEQLSRLLAYSDKYEISIQFWPKQIAVYIAKDGVDLQDYGGDFDFAIGRSIEYLDRVTGNYR